MDRTKAIELIQAVNKGLSKSQIIALFDAKVKGFGGVVSDDGAVNMVLQDLGLAAASGSSDNESFRDRMARMQSEPDKSGTYLKADKVQVGDQVKIAAVSLEPSKEIDTVRGPVTIPARPQVTGDYKARGQKEWGQEVKLSLSKSNEKSLYALWGRPLDECVGLVLMVAAIQRKNINGSDAVWIEWTGLPE